MAKKNSIKVQNVTPAVKSSGNASYNRKDNNVAKNNNAFSINILSNTHVYAILFLVFIVTITLNICLQNQITNWDDPGYIQENALIKDISLSGLKHIFSLPVMGNYYPLTILSYALEYNFVQFEPWLYHFDNLFIHIIDTVLIYLLVFLLSKNIKASIITALLFGIHPMHVESVAWLSGRKDVLYCLFYIGSCIFYCLYINSQNKYRKTLYYTLVLLLFLFSLLSKPVAVTLPLSLLLIDYLKQRKLELMLFIEKIPHFILSIIFGIVSIKVQHIAGAMDMQKIVYTPFERIALGGYSFISYLWKAIVPVHLCNFYPYPLKINGDLSLLYFLYPLLAILLLVFILKFFRKDTITIFGVLFFVLNIVLLLQFIQVGDAIIADRYTYIPYIGLFYIAGNKLSKIWESAAKNKYYILGCIVVYFLFIGYLSRQRCMVWQDSFSLCRDEIEKEPTRAPSAYNNLGYLYASKCATTPESQEKQIYYDSAHYLLNKATELRPDFVNPYIVLGDLERSTGHYEEARKNYYRIMKIKNKEPNVYLGLAILFTVQKNTDSAGYWFRAAVEINPSPEAHGNLGNFFSSIGKPDSAIIEYTKAIEGNKMYYVPYMNRGEVYLKIDSTEKAMQDLSMAIKLNPDIGEPYYQRSYCYGKKGNKALALQDVEKAISLGYNKIDNVYMNWLRSK